MRLHYLIFIHYVNIIVSINKLEITINEYTMI